MAYIGQDLKSVTQNDMEGSGGWKALEPGEYVMIVTDSDYKANRAGNGHNLMLAVQAVDPKFRGAKWREFLAIDNKSVDATRIARAKLKQLGLAVGVKNPDFIADSAELHHKPFVAVVTTEPASEPKYGDVSGVQNRIKAFKPTVGGVTQAVAQDKQEVDTAVEEIDADLPF